MNRRLYCVMEGSNVAASKLDDNNCKVNYMIYAHASQGTTLTRFVTLYPSNRFASFVSKEKLKYTSEIGDASSTLREGFRLVHNGSNNDIFFMSRLQCACVCVCVCLANVRHTQQQHSKHVDLHEILFLSNTDGMTKSQLERSIHNRRHVPLVCRTFVVLFVHDERDGHNSVGESRPFPRVNNPTSVPR